MIKDLLKKGNSCFAVISVQIYEFEPEDLENVNDCKNKVINVVEAIKNNLKSKLANNGEISEPYYLDVPNQSPSWSGEMASFRILNMNDIDSSDFECLHECLLVCFFINFSENYQFSLDEFDTIYDALEDLGGTTLDLPEISQQDDLIYAINLYLVHNNARLVAFQAWEMGEAIEGQLSDPDDEDFNYQWETFSNLVKNFQ